MPDHEPFLRAILAAPGDEAPRLVYADWLDERSDPRGAFLRAEVALFRQPRDGTDFAAAAAALRTQPPGRDYFWAARISRPPVGVCCDRVQFTDSGPALTVEELDAVVGGQGMMLSAQYLAFLLSWNGGSPTPNHFLVPGWGEDDEEYAEAERFFSIYPPGRETADSWMEDFVLAARVLKGFDGNAIGDYVPIATAESDNYLLLGIGGEVRGRVAYFSDYTHNSEAEENIFPIADSLAEFLALLSNHDPEWTKFIWESDLAGLVGWLGAGGDPNAVYSRSGESVLEMAISDEQWEMVAELLRRGADLPRNLQKQIERRGPASLRQYVRDRGRRS